MSIAAVDRVKGWGWYFWPFLVAYFAVKLLQAVLYPDPNMMPDTGEYLRSALMFRTNPYKPIGYSIYLAFNRLILPFPLGVPIMQGLLKLLATAALGSVLRRHYRLPRWCVLALCIVVALNPTALFLDNFLVSDSVFVSFTIGLMAALLAYAQKPTWTVLLFALALAMASVGTKYVGVSYPALVIVFVFLYGRKQRVLRAAVIALSTTGLLLAMAAKTHRDLTVFKLTTFDGWAFHGPIGHLLIEDPWDLARIEDPETRLVCGYLMSFPLHEYADAHRDFFRWHPKSPAKNLLNVFIADKVRPDDVTVRRDSTFLVNFMSMAREPTTPAQELYHRFRNKTNPDYPAYAMSYWGAFIVTNELLRAANGEFMRQHRWTYLTRFYAVSLRKLFLPNEPPIAKGKYKRRQRPDAIVSEFWEGEDSSTWRPRYGDVLGYVNWTHQWFITAVWLAALAALSSAFLRRKELGMSYWGLTTRPGTLLLAFAVIFGAAVAYSHMMEVRYTAPIMPLVITAAALLYFDPTAPSDYSP
jgi:hypothetical protein